ncbi:hypothetical protein TRAPUB_7150 [Trametes pubescens]|uniref:Uncharacterized protein n=1 Tax=Trametes pubescens TaxID=154538 RepID=A0A1M2V418_TRAPU|nr:hypothetical protein TRAPUB_7150 [Trametes pubescens]
MAHDQQLSTQAVTTKPQGIPRAATLAPLAVVQVWALCGHSPYTHRSPAIPRWSSTAKFLLTSLTWMLIIEISFYSGATELEDDDEIPITVMSPVDESEPNGDNSASAGPTSSSPGSPSETEGASSSRQVSPGDAMSPVASSLPNDLTPLPPWTSIYADAAPSYEAAMSTPNLHIYRERQDNVPLPPLTNPALTSPPISDVTPASPIHTSDGDPASSVRHAYLAWLAESSESIQPIRRAGRWGRDAASPIRIHVSLPLAQLQPSPRSFALALVGAGTVVEPWLWLGGAVSRSRRVAGLALAAADATVSPLLPVRIRIPLVVIGILFVVGVTLACGSRHFRRFSNWGTGAAQAAGASSGTTPANARELTADQLAGTNGTTTNNASGGTNRARRPRRTRRTPSQISTHSLPAYNKEPGEQEIVIVRGAEDMEDMPIPITVTMPAVDERADTPDGSFDNTRPSSEYVAMPESPNDEPLLQNNEQHLNVASNDSAPRRSFDSAMSSDENAAMHYTDDAPPYEAYEAVSLDGPESPASPPSSAAPPTAGASGGQGSQQAPAEQPGSTRRRSVFRSIFNPRNSRLSPPPVPTSTDSHEPRTSSHTRDGSNPSIVSLAPSERPRSRVRHRPSQSGSGSMLSLLSRTRSNNNLAADRLSSPSMISLNSISSPLSHTLVRTDFTYPKSGPTPEQLKLISSRESFARFGVPYGRDAIAFAASSSRIELEPPPGFEEVAGTSGAADSSSTEAGNDSSSSGLPSGIESAETVEAESSSSGDDVPAPAVETDPATHLDTNEVVGVAAVNDADVSPSTEATSAAQPSTSSASVTPAPAAASAFSESAGPTSPPPLLSPPVSASATSPTVSNAPPSAFKGAFNTGSLPTRTASRASSYMSFATAEESLPSSEPPTPGASHYDLHVADDAYGSAAETPVNGSSPTTPRLETRHLHESTDTTITPDR